VISITASVLVPIEALSEKKGTPNAVPKAVALNSVRLPDFLVRLGPKRVVSVPVKVCEKPLVFFHWTSINPESGRVEQSVHTGTALGGPVRSVVRLHTGSG
jgi:hypothetical protein